MIGICGELVKRSGLVVAIFGSGGSGLGVSELVINRVRSNVKSVFPCLNSNKRLESYSSSVVKLFKFVILLRFFDFFILFL